MHSKHYLILFLTFIYFSQYSQQKNTPAKKTAINQKGSTERIPVGWTVSISSGVMDENLQADPQGNVYCIKGENSNGKYMKLILRYVNDSTWIDVTPENILTQPDLIGTTEKGLLLLTTEDKKRYVFDGTKWQETSEYKKYIFQENDVPNFIHKGGRLRYPADRNIVYISNIISGQCRLYEKIDGHWKQIREYEGGTNTPLKAAYNAHTIMAGDKLFCASEGKVYVLDPSKFIVRKTKYDPGILKECNCTVSKDTVKGKWTMLEEGFLIDFAADKFGQMYCIMDESAGKKTLNKWADDHWERLPKPGNDPGIRFQSIWINLKDELIVQAHLKTGDDQLANYHLFAYRDKNLVLLSGPEEEDMKNQRYKYQFSRCTTNSSKKAPAESYPAYIEKSSCAILDQQRDRCLSVCNLTASGRNVLLDWDGEKWNKLQEFDGVRGRIRFLSGNTLFSNDATMLWCCDLSHKEVKENWHYNITPAKIVWRSTEGKFYYPDMPKDVGIFSKNGKLGLRTNAGKIIAYPVFDSITFELSPHPALEEKEKEFLFHLKGQGMDIYCTSDNWDPDKIQGEIISKTPCTVCNGTGRMKDEVTQVSDKKWVDNSSTSSSSSYERVWDSGCNCYLGVRTKVSSSSSGGYYKDNGYSTIVIPGGICKACEGGKQGIKVSQNTYAYNPNLKKYTLIVAYSYINVNKKR